MDGQRQTGDHLATFYDGVMSPSLKIILMFIVSISIILKKKGLNERYVKLKVNFFVRPNGNT
jgi:hypothetical protein